MGRKMTCAVARNFIQVSGATDAIFSVEDYHECSTERVVMLP
jgi:hypothetical protein